MQRKLRLYQQHLFLLVLDLKHLPAQLNQMAWSLQNSNRPRTIDITLLILIRNEIMICHFSQFIREYFMFMDYKSIDYAYDEYQYQ